MLACGAEGVVSVIFEMKGAEKVKFATELAANLVDVWLVNPELLIVYVAGNVAVEVADRSKKQ